MWDLNTVEVGPEQGCLRSLTSFRTSFTTLAGTLTRLPTVNWQLASTATRHMKPVKQRPTSRMMKCTVKSPSKIGDKRVQNPHPITENPAKHVSHENCEIQKEVKNGPKKRDRKRGLKSHPSAQMTSSSILWLTSISTTSSIS
jgi:hypothetical protein